MEVSEILKKVRRIQIIAHRQVDDLLAGAYRSVFKGRGMDFDEVREYSVGDDVRTIDWNVTARAGHPFIKRFAEERELTVLFLVDMSRSGLFGTQEGSKLDLMIEMAAVTPPIGFNLFVLQGATGFPIGRVARAAFPFFVLMVVGVVLLALFPQIALWFPDLIYGA